MSGKQALKIWKFESYNPAYIKCGNEAKAKKNRSVDGNPLKIAGESFSDGFGVHPDGFLLLNLFGTAQTFRGKAGIDDEVVDGTRVATGFVWIENAENNELLWQSPELRGGEKSVPFQLSVKKVRKLRIRWTGGSTGTPWSHIDLVSLEIRSYLHEPEPMSCESELIQVSTKRIQWCFSPFTAPGCEFQQFGMLPVRQNLIPDSVFAWRTYPPMKIFREKFSLLPSNLKIMQGDGSLNCVMSWLGVETIPVNDGVVETVFHFRDEPYGTEADFHVLAYRDEDVFRAWTVVRNRGGANITLFDRDAVSVYFSEVSEKTRFRTFRGFWGQEGCVVEDSPLPLGTVVNQTCCIAHNSHGIFPGCFLSFDGEFKEESGFVFGAALACDCDRRFRVTRDTDSHLYFDAGANPTPFVLEPGREYISPEIVMTFSDRGVGEASRNFHRYLRNWNGYRNSDRERPIVLNSWEGCHFDFNEDRLKSLVADAAHIGAEMFVLDDGWFGSEFPRDNDSAGLGDWEVNRAKIPDGFEFLIEECHRNGLKFGLWFEPEMINTRSRLYREHPDWVLRLPNRPLEFGRGDTQLMLDLSRPDVEEFVYRVVADYLERYPGIEYVKWDHNMKLLNHGSVGINANSVSELSDAAFRRISEKLSRNFPNVIFQLCAGGGGRTDYGSIRGFEEFWASDRSTFVSRAWIQWADSFFFPANMTASHINADGEPFVPYKCRVDMAMSGRLGVELVPSSISDSDREIVRKGIEVYKTLRPMIHSGEIFRGRSPHAGPVSEFNFVLPDQSGSVFFLFRRSAEAGSEIVRIPGLSPLKTYKVEERNPDENPRFQTVVMTGAELMKNGLEVEYPPRFSSLVALIQEQR